MENKAVNVSPKPQSPAFWDFPIKAAGWYGDHLQTTRIIALFGVLSRVVSVPFREFIFLWDGSLSTNGNCYFFARTWACSLTIAGSPIGAPEISKITLLLDVASGAGLLRSLPTQPLLVQTHLNNVAN